MCKKDYLMRNRIAILMATYNGEKFIQQQLESILNQTYKKFDLIIRDDGSTDATLTIMWCWRARSKGWIIIQDNTCPFVHQIENTKKVLNKIPAAPFRLYYVYRNSIYILRNLPYGKNKGLKYKLFKQLIFNSIFCSKRKERLKYIILGINDGVKNQLGKLS